MRSTDMAHTFPTIGPDSHDRDRSDDSFRPLFNDARGEFHSQKNPSADAKEDGKENDPLAIALKESYDRGVDAGNKEACSFAQKTIEPSMDLFYASLNAFANAYGPLTKDCASQIITLALAVAGKIAKTCLTLSSDEMVPIEQAIDDMLRDHHQLKLLLNSQDLKELADLMRCRNIEMNDAGAVKISVDDAVQRGTLQFTNTPASSEALREDMARVLERLPGARPSKKASTS